MVNRCYVLDLLCYGVNARQVQYGLVKFKIVGFKNNNDAIKVLSAP